MTRSRAVRLAAACGAILLSVAVAGCDPDEPAAPPVPPPVVPPPTPTAGPIDGVASGTVAGSAANTTPTTRRASP
jgi:hypothetical protein